MGLQSGTSKTHTPVTDTRQSSSSPSSAVGQALASTGIMSPSQESSIRAAGSFRGGRDRTWPSSRKSCPCCRGLNLRSPRSLKRRSCADTCIGVSFVGWTSPGSCFQMACERLRWKRSVAGSPTTAMCEPQGGRSPSESSTRTALPLSARSMSLFPPHVARTRPSMRRRPVADTSPARTWWMLPMHGTEKGSDGGARSTRMSRLSAMPSRGPRKMRRPLSSGMQTPVTSTSASTSFVRSSRFDGEICRVA